MGLEIGSNILKKYPKCEHPSISAASFKLSIWLDLKYELVTKRFQT
jgi:hypothetical protein